MVSPGQHFFGLVMAVVLLVIAEGRTQYYQANEIERIQNELPYKPFFPYQILNRYPDSQYKQLAFFFEGQHNSKLGSSLRSYAENLLREPESKRQAVRYRQCYFNPISCFRK